MRIDPFSWEVPEEEARRASTEHEEARRDLFQSYKEALESGEMGLKRLQRGISL